MPMTIRDFNNSKNISNNSEFIIVEQGLENSHQIQRELEKRNINMNNFVEYGHVMLNNAGTRKNIVFINKKIINNGKYIHDKLYELSESNMSNMSNMSNAEWHKYKGKHVSLVEANDPWHVFETFVESVSETSENISEGFDSNFKDSSVGNITISVMVFVILIVLFMIITRN